VPPTSPSSLARSALALFGFLAASIGALAAAPLLEHGEIHALARALPAWTVAPFALLLLCIAVAPLAVPKAWERHLVKGAVCLALALPACGYLVATWGEVGVAQLFEKAREYISFTTLLASLFIICGGIFVRGSLSGTPLMNTAFLGIGALLANVIGTTGASMLLIRPLLRANVARQRKTHVVVFFIFIVSNCGGLLTPLGDPPLFLGLLKGVPFEWTLSQLFWPWFLVNGALLALFQTLDQAIFEKEERSRPGSQLEEVMVHAPLGIEGWPNLALLAGVVLLVFASGRGLGRGGESWPFGWQEGGMLALAALSYFATPARLHEKNAFSFGPIVEVGVLFAGIFATMAPALLLLNAHGASLGLHRPWHFFWAAGALSSFLDNAPTYLTFAAAAAGLHGIAPEGRYLAQLLAQPAGVKLLQAISAGAVMMGANTYIGNGPNFMVKAVAEQSGLKMPSFFAYMIYSCFILLPLFALVTAVFFRA